VKLKHIITFVVLIPGLFVGQQIYESQANGACSILKRISGDQNKMEYLRLVVESISSKNPLNDLRGTNVFGPQSRILMDTDFDWNRLDIDPDYGRVLFFSRRVANTVEIDYMAVAFGREYLLIHAKTGVGGY